MSTLVVIQSSPFGNTNAKDALDVLLTLAAFEQEPGLMLQDAGVTLLGLENSGPFKDPGKMLGALPMYDVEQLFIDQDAVAKYAIDTAKIDACPMECQLLEQSDMGKLMAKYQHGLVF